MNIDLPIRYDEASCLIAAFPASRRRLQDLTPSPLRVVGTGGGRAPLAIICFEYARTSIGRYHELGVAWPVVPTRAVPLAPLLAERSWPGLGWWIRHLPVTTDLACAGGRELWGYPKIVADIDFDWHGSRRSCALTAGGHHALTLTAETRMPARPQRFVVRTYSILDQALLTTEIDVDAVGWRRMVRARASLELGAHPIGRELASLEPNLERPLEVRWFPTWRALLPAACARRPLANPAAAGSTGAAA